MVDPISDMLTRIRNAQAVGHPAVEIPFSKFKYNLAQILLKEGLIKAVTHRGRKARKVLDLKLKYEDGQPKISSIKRISKQGQRIYKSKDELLPVRQGYGLAILSTSKGLLTDKEAKKKKIGGEVICEIY